MSNNNCVVILCLPRTGSSLLANILHNLNFETYHHEGDQTEYNPDGYFETLHFVSAHEKFIGQTMEEVLQRKGEVILDSEYQNLYKRLVNEYDEKDKDWVLKDSRLLFMFEYWIEYKDLSNVKVISTTRNLDSIIKSVLNYQDIKDKFTYNQVMKAMLLRQYLKRKAISMLQEKGIDILTVNYGKLVNNPKREIERICEFVGREFKPELVDIVKPDYKHF